MTERDDQPMDRLNEYLDGDSESAAEAGRDLTGIPKEEVARHLLIAGITRHLLSDTESGTTEEKVRQGVRDVVQSEQTARRRGRMFAGLAAAAVVTVTAIVFSAPKPTLDPLLDKIRGFVHDDIDREYSLRFQGVGLLLRNCTFRLFVRGTEQYATQLELNLLGRNFEGWMGSDGEQNWFVPPDFGFGGQRPPVLVSSESLSSLSESGQLDERLRELVRIESGMRLMSVLRDLDRNYKVVKTPETANRLLMDAGQADLIAYRRPQADITIPESIRMIVDEDTGVLKKIVVKFVETPEFMGVAIPFDGVSYELIQEELLAGSIYQHYSHHDDDREVIFIR